MTTNQQIETEECKWETGECHKMTYVFLQQTS